MGGWNKVHEASHVLSHRQCMYQLEEMSTILTQIEACLNFRPLCQIPSDSNDPQALTPCHFLIGGPLMTLPDADYSIVPMNKLSR